MSKQMDEIPSDEDVRLQLKRILNSPLFKNSRKQSHLLRFIVESSVENKDIDEKEICEAMSTPYDPDSNTARQAALVVRKKIKHFYEVYGRNDLVKIDPMPGIAYKVEKSYRPQAKAMKKLEQATSFKQHSTFFSLSNSISLFQEVIELAPELPDPYFEITSATLQIVVLNFIFTPGLDCHRHGRVSYDALRELFTQVCSHYPDSWRAHAHLGALRLLEYQHLEATKEFDIALSLDSESLRKSMWFKVANVSRARA